MKRPIRFIIVVFLACTIATEFANGSRIPPEKQDLKNIYWGNPDAFEKPAEVCILELVRATPEFKTVQDRKVQRGTGQYWLLMERASQRALRAITTFGSSSEYDLIARIGYLGGLTPPIVSDDVTAHVLKALQQD